MIHRWFLAHEHRRRIKKTEQAHPMSASVWRNNAHLFFVVVAKVGFNCCAIGRNSQLLKAGEFLTFFFSKNSTHPQQTPETTANIY